MFEQLRSAFDSLSSNVTTKTIDEKKIEMALHELEISLLESDVSYNVVEALLKNFREKLLGLNIARSTDANSLMRQNLMVAIKSLFPGSDTIDLMGSINAKKTMGEPYVIAFLGVNGTGKTTSLAKVAHFMKNQGFLSVLACADTFRAGSIEQLIEHSRRLSLKSISQGYGSDPAAVARDAVIYAKTHGVPVVLIDTAGRMQNSKNLMDELNKIMRVTKPDLKIFVGDALAGNDAVLQAQSFSDHIGFDAVLLTKTDADVKGGSALSISYTTGKPILFIGIGQNYDSLKPFDPEEFASIILMS